MSNHLDERARRRRPPANAVGVRDLKIHAARILRHVREARASYVLTHRGRAVGVILPVDPAVDASLPIDEADAGTAWDAFLRAGRRLEPRFRRGVSGTRLLSEARR